MSRKKKKANYLTEDAVQTRIVQTVTCDQCGDVIEIGNMKGCFYCPLCGNEINLNNE